MSDHNKCPSSEKEHEKCIFRLSYFQRIQPMHKCMWQRKLAGTLNEEEVPILKIAHREISLKFLLRNLQILQNTNSFNQGLTLKTIHTNCIIRHSDMFCHKAMIC